MRGEEGKGRERKGRGEGKRATGFEERVDVSLAPPDNHCVN